MGILEEFHLSSQIVAQQNGTMASCDCITKSSRWSSNNIFEARALFICLLHGVLIAANKMSYGSYFIFLRCFQDVTTSDPIQVKDLLKKWCMDIFGELQGTKSRIKTDMQFFFTMPNEKVKTWTHKDSILSEDEKKHAKQDEKFRKNIPVVPGKMRQGQGQQVSKFLSGGGEAGPDLMWLFACPCVSSVRAKNKLVKFNQFYWPRRFDP